ncbi:hypothetical protein, partial [Mesobacillus foraminis]|uniref:hypothetical protein n=1 Tax=Mesobacillus foraminis TaxID=279826 RepID=UPI001A7EB391
LLISVRAYVKKIFFDIPPTGQTVDISIFIEGGKIGRTHVSIYISMTLLFIRKSNKSWYQYSRKNQFIFNRFIQRPYMSKQFWGEANKA